VRSVFGSWRDPIQHHMIAKDSKKVAPKVTITTETKATKARVSEKSVNYKAAPFGRLAYKISEAAGLIGVSENSIRRLIKGGELKGCGKLRHILIPHSALQEFLGVQEAA